VTLPLRQKKHNSGNCEHCGVWRRSLHRDHVLPKFKGGSDDPSNIQNLCANCHEDKTVEDLTGVPLSANARAAQSAAQTGKPCSPERRAAIIAARNTPESLEKARAAARKGWDDPVSALSHSEGRRRHWTSLSPEERQRRTTPFNTAGASHRFGASDSNSRWEKKS